MNIISSIFTRVASPKKTQGEISLGGEVFFYTLEHKKVKNINLSLKPNNYLKCSVPMGVSFDDAISFIHQQEEWVLKTKQQMDQRVDHRFVGEKEVYYFGEKKRLFHETGEKALIEVGDHLILVSPNSDKDTRDKTFYELSRKSLMKCINSFEEEGAMFLLAHGIDCTPQIAYRKMRSKWGVCVPAKNKITFSTYLVHMPIECIRYVFFHEYAHILQPNHSKQFYALVEEVVPDYKECVKKLKG